jgi:hypothetical protein
VCDVEGQRRSCVAPSIATRLDRRDAIERRDLLHGQPSRSNGVRWTTVKSACGVTLSPRSPPLERSRSAMTVCKDAALTRQLDHNVAERRSRL